MTDEFSRFHPVVNVIFYMVVLIITMFQMQQVMVIISTVCAIIYHIYLKKQKSVKFCIMAFFIFTASAVINPLFSHKGATLLFYMFTGNPCNPGIYDIRSFRSFGNSSHDFLAFHL